MYRNLLRPLGRIVRPLSVSNTFAYSTSKHWDNMAHKEEDLKKRLTPLQYHVTQEKGTEHKSYGSLFSRDALEDISFQLPLQYQHYLNDNKQGVVDGLKRRQLHPLNFQKLSVNAVYPGFSTESYPFQFFVISCLVVWLTNTESDAKKIFRAFTGEYENNKEAGTYQCVVCGEKLFMSDHKYNSGSGWPSFHQTSQKGVVEEHEDSSLGRQRTEVVCNKCKAHLGHVFTDGPAPTGQRYCINSASLKFEKASGKEEL